MLLNDTTKELFEDKLLLLIHHHADVDAVASAIALQTVFEEAVICAPDKVSSHGQKIAEFNDIEIVMEAPKEWEGTVIALDSPNPEHCSPVPKTEQMIVIDHHTKIEGWPEGTEIIHQPNKTSTAEIIIKIIDELGFKINKKCANVLLAAIYTDTGQFRHANNETFNSASILCENGAEPQEVINLLDSERPMIQKVTFLKAAQNMKWIQHGKWIIATSIVGSFESGSARHMIVLGADVAIVDLVSKTVSTVAGIGRQATFQQSFPGVTQTKQTGPWFGAPKKTPINSPWALWVHEDNLYIAMAGPHQIWIMPLDESRIGPYAGNAREDIVDGPLLPKVPYAAGASSFAQPSGLTSDGEYIYVADSEGSSVRGVPFDQTKKVITVVGTSELPNGRLFKFGDKDGKKSEVLLQHVLGVHYDAGKIYIADTYNNKIKVVDAKSGETQTVAGSGDSGASDQGRGEFDEPSGLSKIGNTLYIADTNNHLIRTIDLESKQVGTMAFIGLEPVIEAK